MIIEKLLQEDNKRMKRMYTGFNPLTGEGAVGERVKMEMSDFTIPIQYIPCEMLENEFIKSLIESKTVRNFIENVLEIEYNEESENIVHENFTIIRSRHDFCFWAFVFVKIKPKSGGEIVPFKLRHEQRKLLIEMEDMRKRKIPIRIILLKARQWGGSTLVQIYLAWIQLMHKSGWYSKIVAQNLSVSRTIKAMYSKLLENYPSWMLNVQNQQLEFSPYEGSGSDFVITYGNGINKQVARDSVVTIGTYEKPDGTRGGDTALVHYSEVAIWNETNQKKPEDVIRAITSGLLEVPLTMEVMESTANGTGNFFHKEYLRAKKGESNRKAVFIAWYDIEHDSIEVEDREAFAQWLWDNRESESSPVGYADSGIYHWYLWTLGATFAGINWYRQKRKSYIEHCDMASEAPSDDVEAFKHSGNKIFSIYQIEKIRAKTREPKFVCEAYSSHGDNNLNSLKDVKLTKDNKGLLRIWEDVDQEKMSNRYLVTVDIGGRSEKSDYSVIHVLDRFPLTYGGCEETVAEWRGHIDHDLLAYKAAQIATYYNRALLVFESNTLETKDRDTDGANIEYILDTIGRLYDNLYARESKAEDIATGKPRKWGFHTNTHTKPLVIGHLITRVRELSWIEREAGCCDELNYYEKKQNGSFGAISGENDDRLMTRAIGLWVSKGMDLPKFIVAYIPSRAITERNEAYF